MATAGLAALMLLGDCVRVNFGAFAEAPPPPLAAGTVLVGTNGVVTNIIMLRDEKKKLVAYIYSMNGSHPYIVGGIPHEATFVGKFDVVVFDAGKGAHIMTKFGLITVQRVFGENGNPYIGTMPTGEAGYPSYDEHEDARITFIAYTAEQWLHAMPRGGDGIT